MAGRSAPKRTSRPGYKAKKLRYKSESRYEKNKDLKKLKHNIQLEVDAARVAAKMKLLDKVCSKYNLDSKGKYALKRLIGTVNISRLTSIQDSTLLDQQWFIERKETLSENALKAINNTKLRVFI